MVRRIHVPRLQIGDIPLPPAEAHYAQHVLRLPDGSPVELFDDAGVQADGRLFLNDSGPASVRVFEVRPPAPTFELTVAAAVPKGERADWMVEKLSELGVSLFIPLAAQRSVVLPQGKSKMDRWMRIAIESAKQSRRAMPMRIEPLTSVDALLDARFAPGHDTVGWYCSTDPTATPIARLLPMMSIRLLALIGPEGGWTDAEQQQFQAAGLTAVKLTQTILRVETAALAIAAIVGSMFVGQTESSDVNRANKAPI